jgi:putative flippase GtrA
MGDVHLLRRWAAFNFVGAIGVAVQLGMLAALVRWGELNYLAATTLAVEAAVIHNFVWHQRWTWRDRPATTAREVTARFIRFHLTNGAISLAGNIVLMTALTGILGLDAVLASAMAIASCSLLNFAAGTTFVFRTEGAAAVPATR